MSKLNQAERKVLFQASAQETPGGQGFQNVHLGKVQEKLKRLGVAAVHGGADATAGTLNLAATASGVPTARGVAIAQSAVETPVPAQTPTSVETVAEQPAEEAPEAPATGGKGTDATVQGISLDAIQDLIQGAIAEVRREADDKIQQIRQEAQGQVETAQAQVQEANSQLEQERVAKQKLEGIFKLAGRAPIDPESANSQHQQQQAQPVTKTPGLIKGYDVFGDKPQGAIKDALDMMTNPVLCPTKEWLDENTGDVFVHRDYTYVQRFYRENRKEFRNSFEMLMKANGLLRGNAVQEATAGQTTPATMPDNYLAVLSLILRETHSPKYIWWQFPVTINRPGYGPGSNILLPRHNWLDEPEDETSYILADLDNYYNTSNDNQALVMTTVPAVVKEYGLGKGGSTATRPVAIPEFYSAYSLTSLESALQTRLGHNYNGFEDMMIRNQYMRTTQVRYNNGGSVVEQASDVLSDGELTHQYLGSLYAEMDEDQIPPLPDGCYVMVTPPSGVKSIKRSLDSKMDAPTPAQVMELTNMLTNQGSPEMDTVNGYCGMVENFHIFKSNASSVGAPGSPGVQAETLGGSIGAVPTYSSYVFGRNAVGRGIGMPMEIRSETSGTFGRQTRYIWKSHETHAAIDVDPNSTTPANNQQLRVLEVRTRKS